MVLKDQITKIKIRNMDEKIIMDKKVIKLFEDIKKLAILQLVKGGVPASTEEVGAVLGITGRAVQNIATASKKPRKKKVKKSKK